MTFDKQLNEKCLRDLDREFRDHRALFLTYKGNPVSIESSMDEDMAEKITKSQKIHTLHWKKPNSGIFCINYVLIRGTLMVGGDLGEATYCWNQEIDWQFLVNTNFDYFSGKSMWVEGYKRPTTWMGERVAARIAEHLEEYPEDKKLFEDSFVERGDKHAWTEFIRDNERLVEMEAWDWGEAINFRAFAHWYGIKCAVKQLSEVSKKSKEDGKEG
jgi:hypothetical protein